MNENQTLNQTSHHKGMGMKAKKTVGNTLGYITLILISIVWLIPFVCIVVQSFRVETKNMTSYILPYEWGFDNYITLFTETKFLQWYGNTLIIALVSCVGQTAFILAMSYVLSRLRFKGRKFLMNFMLVLGMFPGFLTMILIYFVLKMIPLYDATGAQIGFTQANSIPGLIIIYIASSGMGYYVCKGFFDTIPKSLDEAARVDGATRAQVFWKIILPLAKPIIIYTVLTGFMAPWGDFIMASMVAMGNNDGYNVAVGLYSWLTPDQIANKYTIFCAGGVCVAIPVTLLFMFLQKYYVEGVTGGAVKG